MKLKGKKNYLIKLRIMVIVFFIFFLTIFFLFKSLIDNVSKYFINYAEIEATKMVSNIINDAVTVDTYEKLKFDNLYYITKNKNDEVQMIDYNSVIVNEFLNKVTSKIQNDLLLLEKDTLFYMPFGSITNNPLFNNMGPNIPVKLKLINSVLTNINTKIVEYGINNCIVEMNMFIEIKIKIILPIIFKEFLITNEVPISYKIINGKIPNYYTLNGTSKNSNIYSIPLE